jgi:hypothetical protein
MRETVPTIPSMPLVRACGRLCARMPWRHAEVEAASVVRVEAAHKLGPGLWSCTQLVHEWVQACGPTSCVQACGYTGSKLVGILGPSLWVYWVQACGYTGSRLVVLDPVHDWVQACGPSALRTSATLLHFARPSAQRALHPLHPRALHPLHPLALHPLHPLALHPLHPLALQPTSPAPLQPCSRLATQPLRTKATSSPEQSLLGPSRALQSLLGPS